MGRSECCSVESEVRNLRFQDYIEKRTKISKSMCEKRRKTRNPLPENQTHDTRVYCLPMVPKHKRNPRAQKARTSRHSPAVHIFLQAPLELSRSLFCSHLLLPCSPDQYLQRTPLAVRITKTLARRKGKLLPALGRDRQRPALVYCPPAHFEPCKRVTLGFRLPWFARTSGASPR